MTMRVLRLPSWGMSYCEATYYGWRHSLHVGPLLIFWGMIAPEETE